jgi:predicted RNA binding protein YcfA (HicA-like mRNA interferase family)
MATSSREIIARLKKEGWVKVSQRGSHTQWKHPDRPGRVTVPHPKRELAVGTLRSICRQAGWVVG